MKVFAVGLLLLFAISLSKAAPLPIQAQKTPQLSDIPPPREKCNEYSSLFEINKNPTPHNIITAWSLILQDDDNYPDGIEDNIELLNAVTYVAIKNELIDEREMRHFVLAFDTETNYITRTTVVEGLKAINARYVEGKTLPKIADADKFYFYGKEADNCLRFNSSYRNHLLERIAWEPDREAILHVAVKETDALRNAWVNVTYACSAWAYIYDRRKCLAQLKRDLGEDYNLGIMPPCVPHWRFNYR